MKMGTGKSELDAPVIEGTEWHLVEVGGEPVSPLAGEKQPHIILDHAQNQATGFAGCNNVFGSYVLDGSSLKFGPVGATRMFCEGKSGEVELLFMQAMENTRSWEIRDSTLLLLKDGEVLARFTIHQGDEGGTNLVPQLTGTVWQWVQTLYNDDRRAMPPEPQNYAVQFLEDGTLSVKADCNMKGGSWSASPEEKRIAIEITHSTMAACTEGSLENEFVRGLSGAAIYFMKDGDLYIDLKYDSGTMRFSKH